MTEETRFSRPYIEREIYEVFTAFCNKRGLKTHKALERAVILYMLEGGMAFRKQEGQPPIWYDVEKINVKEDSE